MSTEAFRRCVPLRHGRARAYAVIDGRRFGAAARLGAGDTVSWDCLQRGAKPGQPTGRLVRKASPFTDWLLGEAIGAYPGWGLLMISLQPLLPVREHCRSIGDVTTPDGERRSWRWYDPEVLRAILPALLAGQLDEIFAIGQSIVVPAPDAWTWLAMENGLLATDSRPLMAAAR
jgi:hypothetical protein